MKSNDYSPSRRRFLEILVASAGGVLATGACGDPHESDLQPSDPSAYFFFPQSVASGDPRPTSVVLWTRVVDFEREGAESFELELEVAKDEAFSELVELDGKARLALTAEIANDGCVKVRVTGLEPWSVYYYRFWYRASHGAASSPVGRTKTAPEDGADVPVRFAVISCQDYDDKLFHALAHLVEQDVDFVVHLGDYVYESGVEELEPGGFRRMVFTKPEEALRSDGGLKARSLDNYRDLYRTVRSDSELRALHERLPMIAIPDDHEFSDDSHGATATYLDGASDELDLERKRNSDRAWFEYMPVDYASGPGRELDPSAEFPDDFAIYRSFGFGRHLELVMTDLRRYRPDHLIPEDAFPGAVFMTAAEAEEDAVSEELRVPYVDVESYEEGAYRDALVNELGFGGSRIRGNLSVPWINARLAEAGGDDLPPPIDEQDESLERGLAIHQLLKNDEFSRIGSRYFVALEPFEALAARRYRESNGASERLMGDAQRAWFLETLKASNRTFKVWGSEIAFLPKHLNLTGNAFAPPELQQRIGLTAEDWDGFPNERRELLRELSDVDNLVVLSGDLHCFFAGTPFDAAEPARRVVEFTIGSVTSTTWREGIRTIVASNQMLPPEVTALAPAIGSFLTSRVPPVNPHLAFQELGMNGYAVVDVSADAMDVELFMLTPEDVATLFDVRDPPPTFTSVRFHVPAGEAALERPTESGFERWDVEQMKWV